jgi:periplasmic divalent cation tolerance protein
LADVLLTQKLAACITIIPSAESHYCWKGKREKASEFVLLIKTRSIRYKKLETILKTHHSYSVPEIISVPVQKGNPAYLRWLSDSVP